MWKAVGDTLRTTQSNFTPRAQQVVSLARKEADRFNHNFVGTEHLLLGIIKLGQGVAVNVLQKMGLDLETVRIEVEKQVGTGPDQKMIGNIPYTPRVKKVLALAAKEARALNHTYVGTEHILLGLLREGDGVAARVLMNLNVDIEQTRHEILKELEPNLDASRAPENLPTDEPPRTKKEPLSFEEEDFGRMFTPRAQEVLKLAHNEADRFKHGFVGTEHLLLGLIAIGKGVASTVLQKLGLDLERVRQEVEKQLPPGPHKIDNIPYTPGIKKVLTLAAREAKALQHTYVGTEHLLLGLLNEDVGVGSQFLKNLGVNIKQTRVDILKELDPNFDGAAAPTSTPPAKRETQVASPTMKDEPIDTTKPYDIYCTVWGQGVTIYRNTRFKGKKHLFQNSQYDYGSVYLELELSDGQSIFVARSSVIRFCDPGTTPGP
jgi:ATP-dependent Clp protease ATP-binding subunit ClpA